MGDDGMLTKLNALKAATPVVVDLGKLAPFDAGQTLNTELARLIYATVKGITNREDVIAAMGSVKSCQDTVRALLEAQGGPLVLVLDEITTLANDDNAGYYASEVGPSALYRAMRALSLKLNMMLAIPGCFVYCTGRSMWLTLKALCGESSPLFGTAILLRPLTATDMEASLELTASVEGRHLLDRISEDARTSDGSASLRSYFVRRAVEVTGGVGRALQYVFRGLGSKIRAGAPLETEGDVEEELSLLADSVVSAGVVGMAFAWDGPISSEYQTGGTAEGDNSLRHKFARLFGRMLLLDSRFAGDTRLSVSAFTSVLLTDAAATLGLSFAPVDSDDGEPVRGSRDAAHRLAIVAVHRRE
ncbi:hypothetical protein EON66_08660 [archaeon]|nr:MAG: hypothetical protein EON66_08660 [archaeon]